jgi:hypothetical protein
VFINNNPVKYIFSAFNQSLPSIKLNFVSTKGTEDNINSLKSKDSHGYDEISIKILKSKYSVYFITINPLNAKLNPICHLLALLGAHPILHISRVRVNLFM